MVALRDQHLTKESVMPPVIGFFSALLLSIFCFRFIRSAINETGKGNYLNSVFDSGVAMMLVALIALLISASPPAKDISAQPAIPFTSHAVDLSIVRKNAEVYCPTGEVIPIPAEYRNFWFQITMEGPQAVIAQTVLVPGEPQLAYKSSRTFLADIRYRDLPVFSNWIHARAQEKANFADWFSRRQFKTVCFADGTQAVAIMF